MTDLEKAARMALEALGYYEVAGLATTRVAKSITALRQALSNSVEQPAQQQEPVAIDRLYIEALIEGLYQNEDPVSIDAAEEFERLLKTPASPPANANAGKPWVGLDASDYCGQSEEWCDGALAAEAILKEKNIK